MGDLISGQALGYWGLPWGMLTQKMRDIHIGPGMVFRANLINGQVRRIRPTGRGREVKFVASPVARALSKALGMGLRAGKGLGAIVDRLEAGMGRVGWICHDTK